MGPSLASASATILTASSRTEPVIARALTLGYLVLISATRRSISLVVRARAATEAPDAAKARAVSRPMPRDAPVMRTTFPTREPASLEGAMKG